MAAVDPAAFPFRCELSLAPLITFWTQTSAYHEFGRGPIPGIVREKAREAPELAGVIDDLSVTEKHRAFVDLMMTAMFSPAFWEQEYGAALFPFQLRAFYATPPFRRALMSADGSLQGRASFLQAHSVAQFGCSSSSWGPMRSLCRFTSAPCSTTTGTITPGRSPRFARPMACRPSDRGRYSESRMRAAKRRS